MGRDRDALCSFTLSTLARLHDVASSLKQSPTMIDSEYFSLWKVH